jgi:hypothetical protein
MLNKDKKVDEDFLIGIFIYVDDALKAMEAYAKSHWLEAASSKKKPTRKPSLTASEIITILIYYHYSGYKCFSYYYHRFLKHDLSTYFPKACSYNRFLELMERVQLPLYLLGQLLCQQTKQTGVCFIGSHKVFKGLAERSKTSMGWFFGFKLHLVVNNQGEILAFDFSKGNKADNNANLLEKLLAHLKGLCFGDKGYLTKIWENFYHKGLKIITKARKNMKNVLLPLKERYLLTKRAMIESVFDIFTSVLDLEHSRHRNPQNAFSHMLATILAYQFYPNKPNINLG